MSFLADAAGVGPRRLSIEHQADQRICVTGCRTKDCAGFEWKGFDG
jgi:hypothetical protein